MDPQIQEYDLKKSGIIRQLYLAGGFTLVAIGVLGIFLPLLPTTIFLILASICFMKSSPRAHNWLVNHKYLGSYLRNYKHKTGLSVTSKITHLLILWLGIGLSAIYFTDNTAVRILLLLIALGVSIHLITIKTARK